METALLDGRLWMTTTDLITEESFCLAWLVRDVRWRTEELIWDNVATMNYHLCYFKAGTDNAQRKLELHALQDTGYQDNPGPLGNQRHWLFSSDISYLALPVKAERWRMPFSSTVHQLTCRATWGVAHRLTLFSVFLWNLKELCRKSSNTVIILTSFMSFGMFWWTRWIKTKRLLAHNFLSDKQTFMMVAKVEELRRSANATHGCFR